jgi:hypothetical protein
MQVTTSQAKREREAREAERRQVFEQETLVGLQDALEELYQIVEDVLRERFPPEIDADQFVDTPDSWSEPLVYRTAEAAVDKLRARVLDDDLRELIDKVLYAAGMVMHARKRSAADRLQEDLWTLSGDVNQHVGEQLRRLFKP